VAWANLQGVLDACASYSLSLKHRRLDAHNRISFDMFPVKLFSIPHIQ
jgi:hypothetical protein